ncbi:hypothetical protein ABKV19_011153 [Rosa sericea]
MAFLTVNKRNNISLQLAFLLLFLVPALLLVAHARDISSSSRRVDVVVKKGAAASSVLQVAEPVESSDISSSRSSHAFETKHEQENLTGTEGIDDDLLVGDYTPTRKKSPIHN